MLTKPIIGTSQTAATLAERETLWQQNADHIQLASKRFEIVSDLLGAIYSKAVGDRIIGHESNQGLFKTAVEEIMCLYNLRLSHSLKICGLKAEDFDFLTSNDIWDKAYYEFLKENGRSLGSELSYLGYLFFERLSQTIKNSGLKKPFYDFPLDEVFLDKKSKAVIHLTEKFTELAQKLSTF